jgi:hypothetical protein
MIPSWKTAPAVGRFTAAVFSDLAQKTKFVDPALAAAWPRILGDELAGLSRPGRLTGSKAGRTLEVVVPNGAAAARIQFESGRIREKVNDFLGPGVVARIAVRQAGGKPPQTPHDRENTGRLDSALSRFRASFAARREDGPKGDGGGA